MDKDIMHINAVNSICDGYVSGKVSSAFYKVNKKSGNIVKEIVPENFVTPSKGAIDELYKVTLKIERIFDKYQDIEWTIRNSKI
jgi:phosphoenolpyruvate synthase/pyruvate phosphate dikinase